jgi:hypothetical protein
MNPGVSPDDTSSADALAQMAAMFFIGGTASAPASPLVGLISDHLGQHPLIAGAHVMMGLTSMYRH